MRRRLIIAFVALAVSIIGLYGIPRIFTLADAVHASETRYATRMASVIATVIDDRDEPADAAFLEPLLGAGEGLSYIDPEGGEVQLGVRPDGDDISATTEVAAGGTVTFTRSGELYANRVKESITPVVLIGIVLLFASVLAAVLLARALSRPFTALVETAREIGRGNPDPPHQHLPTREARALDVALRDSAALLSQRIRREHEFAANASHQLRTPITAVRLELEDLSLWPETPPVVREQLAHAVREIDRLAEAIAQLLELARGGTDRLGVVEPLDQVVRAAAARWAAQADAAGRSIRVVGADAELGSAAAAASQILDVLLHNALTHGRGAVTITGIRRAEYVTVQVADEGPRPAGNEIFQRRPEQRSATSGEGIGLALSAELAESLGGHLLLEGDATTTFSLILPARS